MQIYYYYWVSFQYLFLTHTESQKVTLNADAQLCSILILESKQANTQRGSEPPQLLVSALVDNQRHQEMNDEYEYLLLGFHDG